MTLIEEIENDIRNQDTLTQRCFLEGQLIKFLCRTLKIPNSNWKFRDNKNRLKMGTRWGTKGFSSGTFAIYPLPQWPILIEQPNNRFIFYADDTLLKKSKKKLAIRRLASENIRQNKCKANKKTNFE